MSATAAVVAEFVSSDRGLGYLLIDYSNQLRTHHDVFAVILVLSAMGLALYGASSRSSASRFPGMFSQRIDAGMATAT